jgi:hypothetical protein
MRKFLLSPDGGQGGNSTDGTAAQVVVEGKTEAEILAEKAKQEKAGKKAEAPASEPETPGVCGIMAKFWGI